MKQSPNNRKIIIWIIAAIVVAGFLLYGGSMQNDYNLDDEKALREYDEYLAAHKDDIVKAIRDIAVNFQYKLSKKKEAEEE